MITSFALILLSVATLAVAQRTRNDIVSGISGRGGNFGLVESLSSKYPTESWNLRGLFGQSANYDPRVFLGLTGGKSIIEEAMSYLPSLGGLPPDGTVADVILTDRGDTLRERATSVGIPELDSIAPVHLVREVSNFQSPQGGMQGMQRLHNLPNDYDGLTPSIADDARQIGMTGSASRKYERQRFVFPDMIQ